MSCMVPCLQPLEKAVARVVWCCMCLQPIVETMAKAVQCYGRRNLRLAYDALGTLAEAAGSR